MNFHDDITYTSELYDATEEARKQQTMWRQQTSQQFPKLHKAPNKVQLNCEMSFSLSSNPSFPKGLSLPETSDSYVAMAT